VDLCAAPGSWSQVLSERLHHADSPTDCIVSVDLQAMSPIPGCSIIKGDITSLDTAQQIISELRSFNPEGNVGGHPSGRTQLVICDGAPDVTGLHDIDEYIQAQLLLAAVNITTHVLAPGGTFVAKIFRGRDVNLLYDQLRVLFNQVSIAKPTSSRNSSIEAFVVCQGFKGGELNDLPLEGAWDKAVSGAGGLDTGDQIPSSVDRNAVPFISCGNLDGHGFDATEAGFLDADRSYDVTRTTLEPVQPPILPPYHQFKQMKKESNAA